MWGATDLVEFLIFICLGLMLLHTVFVAARLFYRYFFAKDAYLDGSGLPSESQRSKKTLAELNRDLRTLNAIVWAAPFLGLAGTAYGILVLFNRGFVGVRQFLPLSVPFDISPFLVATLSGLVVAMAAVVCRSILGACPENIARHSSALLEDTTRVYGFAQSLPLRKRFTGMPAFALVAAGLLGMLVPMVVLMQRPPIPKGLPVHVRLMGAADSSPDAVVVTVIGTGLVNTSSYGQSTVLVNSKATKWNELGNAVRGQLKLGPHWIVYVAAEDSTSWSDVAYAIDVARGLRAEVVLLTAMPGIDSSRKHQAKSCVATK